MPNSKLATEDQVKAVSDTVIELYNHQGKQIKALESGIIDAITPTSPTPEQKGQYVVTAPGIYTNFKDANGQPISVTEEDYTSGTVYIVFNGTDSKKLIVPIIANGEVKEGDTRGVSGNEVYKKITTGNLVLTSGVFNIDYNNKKIRIPKSYYYNNGRVKLEAITFDLFNDSFSNIIIDLENNVLKNIKTVDLGKQNFKHLLIAVISDSISNNTFVNCNNVTINNMPFNFFKGIEKSLISFSKGATITTKFDKIILPSEMVIVCSNERFNFSNQTELTTIGDFGYVIFNRLSKEFRIEVGDYSKKVDSTDIIILAYSKDNDDLNVYGYDKPYKKIDFNLETDFNITALIEPIVINGTKRTVLFPNVLNIYINGKQILIRNSNTIEIDLVNPSGFNCRYLYLDIARVNKEDSLKSDMFISRPQGSSKLTNNNYKLIAVIPDSFFLNNIRPWAVFDFVTEQDIRRNHITAQGWETHIPEVKSLSPEDEDTLLNATKKGEFSKYIQLWDDLIPLTNVVKPYITKCWIDGSPYNDTNKIMSSTPISGTHNTDNNMTTYPLLRYIFKPNTDDRVTYSDDYKPIRKKMLWVSGIHGGSSGGDHWESPVAMYYVAKKLALEFFESETFSRVRNNYEIHFIPALNPWGLDNLQRVNGMGVDCNRDFNIEIGFKTNEAIAIKNIIESEHFDFFYDSHCFGDTRLTTGDLIGSNFMGITSDRKLLQLFRQITNNIGQRFQLKTSDMALVVNTMPYYVQSKGVLSASSEIPANTPLFTGDLVGKPHSKETVRRCVIFLQNVFSIMCNYINK